MRFRLRLFLFFLLSAIPLAAQAWRGEVESDLPALGKAAEGGDPAAMAAYAFRSMHCMDGLSYQPELIFDYFTRSAAAGEAEGKVGLAHCYCFNVGTVRNLKKAQELIQEPLAEGHPVALQVMGFLHYGLQGLMPKDYGKVIEYHQKSADQGCFAARYNLAINAINGVPELDVEKGMAELRLMHEEGIFALPSATLCNVLMTHQIWPDHEEVFNDCVKRLREFAELDDPYALFRLGAFHHEAGDLENAVACYARAAHLGNDEGWFALWRISKYGERKDSGNIWTQSHARSRLAMQAYVRGAFNGYSLADAGWEITRRPGVRANQVRFAQLEVDSLKFLKSGNCNLHDTLGRLYSRAKKELNPQLVRPEWARAHLIAHSHHTADSSTELAHRFFGGEKTDENLARGYACAVCARRTGSSSYKSKGRWKWVQEQMTPKARARAEELIKDDYPSGEKHRRKAEDLLIKIGRLPPREER